MFLEIYMYVLCGWNERDQLAHKRVSAKFDDGEAMIQFKVGKIDKKTGSGRQSWLKMSNNGYFYWLVEELFFLDATGVVDICGSKLSILSPKSFSN